MPTVFGYKVGEVTDMPPKDEGTKLEIDHKVPAKKKLVHKATYKPLHVAGPSRNGYSFIVDIKRVKNEPGFKMFFARVAVDTHRCVSSIDSILSRPVYGDDNEVIDYVRTFHESYPVMVYRNTDGSASVSTKMPSTKVKGRYLDQFGGPLADEMRVAAEIAVKLILKGEAFELPEEGKAPYVKSQAQLRQEFVDHMEDAYNSFMEENSEYLIPKKGIRTAALNFFIDKHQRKEVKKDG